MIKSNNKIPKNRLPNAPKIPFRDLRIIDDSFRNRLLSEVEDVLVNGPLLMGSRVERFEEELAKFCNRKFCIGVSSGTDALYLALKACDIGLGDEVITTGMSWVATLNAILMVGATPVFVDVGEDQNLNPDEISDVITKRTKAILPVHFTGRLCDMLSIRQIAQKFGLLVIEDAAQAIGAKAIGFAAGTVGDVAAFSLNPMKVFPGYGEAGAIVTDNSHIADRLRTLRYLGTDGKEMCSELALNHKMDEIQAAMLLLGFEYIGDIVDKRIDMARRYSRQLTGLVGCPATPEVGDRTSNYYDYVIFCENRDALREHLRSAGVETKVKHSILLPDQPINKLDKRPDLVITDRLVKTMISLPLHEKLLERDINYVCNSIAEFLNV